MFGEEAGRGAIIGVVLVICAVGFLGFLASRWRKAGPNEALVVYGLRKKCVVGGGVFVIPGFETCHSLSLEIMTLDVTTPEVYTAEGVPVIVDGVAQVKVDGSDEAIRTAAEQFLGKSTTETMSIALQTVEGHLRAILGTMTVEDIYKNRDAFAQQVQEVAASDLANMGLRIVSFTIRDIRDNKGYLEALGKPRIAQVKRDATIGEAEAQRDATIRSAQANQVGQEARYQAEANIAQAERDYNIKRAEYNQAVQLKQAEADLAYELQKNKTNQEIRREQVQVDVVEKEMQIKVQDAEIERRQRELAATVQRPADAERYRLETIAQGEKSRIEIEAEAKGNAARAIGMGEAEAAKAKGIAMAEVRKATGLAEAEVAKAVGLAEAEAIRAKGSGEAEAMAKKAEAWKQYNEAAIVEKVVSVLPDIASAIATPLAKTERIVMVNTGGDSAGGVGVSRITGDIASVIAQLPPVLESLSGVDIAKLLQSVPGLSKPAAATPAESAPQQAS